MNVVVLSGNLTKDIEVKTTSGGKKVARGTIAVRNGSDKTDFFNFVAWEARAEFMENGTKDGRYLSGCTCTLNGQMHMNEFDSVDQSSGQTRKVRAVELTVTESHSDRKKDWQPQQGGQTQQGSYQQPQGGYQQPQRGGYQPQPQGGYPPQRGGYQPQQPQGGYQAAQQAPQGSYQPQPQGGYQAAQQAPQHDGYQPAPAPQPQGTYQAVPPAPQPQGVQTGSFQPIPAQNAAPAPSGGFKAAAVNAPRAGQATYGGYPEGAGYGN